MALVTADGVSYQLTITSEELSVGLIFGNISKRGNYKIAAPTIKQNRAYSAYVGKNPQQYAGWSFGDISIPRFDGISKYTGMPSNYPDFISENHFLGVMRGVELATKEYGYKGLIGVKVNAPRPKETA